MRQFERNIVQFGARRGGVLFICLDVRGMLSFKRYDRNTFSKPCIFVRGRICCVLKRMWDAVSDATVKNLAESFRGRCERCVAAGGVTIVTKK